MNQELLFKLVEGVASLRNLIVNCAIILHTSQKCVISVTLSSVLVVFLDIVILRATHAPNVKQTILSMRILCH